MAPSHSIVGRRNKQITIQSVSEVQNSLGEPIETWATYCTRYASVIPLNGREYFSAKQTESENTIKFLLNYDSTAAAATTKHRISWNGRIFNIESVINVDEANRDLLIIAREIT